MLRKDPFVTGEYYHLYNRGIDKRSIFKLDRDYQRFKMLLYIANNQDTLRLDNLISILHKSYSEIMSLKKDQSLVSIGAWCLMPNHFHILLKQEVDGGITRFMRKLGVGYSMFFNIKYKRQGALFGGLFKSKLISDDVYMRHLFAYIHLNPLDIEFKDWDKKINLRNEDMDLFLKLYQHSSYQDYLYKSRVESNILNKSAFPEYFNSSKSFENFIQDYLTFLN